MNKTTSVNPKIKNWKEVKEQFGLTVPIGKGYKTAIEISRDLIYANQLLDLQDKREQPRPTQRKGVFTYAGNDEQGTKTCIMIDCEKDNFDSAFCTFDFVGMEGEQRIYEYLGTAK